MNAQMNARRFMATSKRSMRSFTRFQQCHFGGYKKALETRKDTWNGSINVCRLQVSTTIFGPIRLCFPRFSAVFFSFSKIIVLSAKCKLNRIVLGKYNVINIFRYNIGAGTQKHCLLKGVISPVATESLGLLFYNLFEGSPLQFLPLNWSFRHFRA